MSSQQHYAWRDLPSKIRARLAHSLTHRTLYAHADAPSTPLFYGLHGAGIAVTLLLLYWLAGDSYGDPQSGSGWGDHGVIIAWFVLLGALAVLGLRCAERYRLTQLFGFAPGRYVLPFALVEAGAAGIVIHDLMQLKALEITHYTTNGSYTKSVLSFTMKDGKLHLFTVRRKKSAELAYERFHQLQAETRKAFAERDLDSLKQLDPLVELRQNKWELPPGRQRSDPPTRWQRLRLNHVFAGVAIALVAAPAVWAFRTAANDAAMHKQALALHTEAAYLGYLARGHFYVEPMRAALPRVSYDEVVKQGSVSALRQLLARYPQAGLDQDVAAAIHVQYQNSLEKFMKQAQRSDQALVEAMAGLLAQMEARRSPDLPVRFVRPSSEQLVELDRALAKRGAVDGRRIIPASEYFSNDSAAAREVRIVAGLQSAFQTIFPHDVLRLVSVSPHAKVQPVLDIHYEIEPSGAVYVPEKDDGRGFVGLRVRFDSALVASETAPQWRFKLDVKPPEHFTVQYKEGGGSASGPQAGEVYAVMAERAFDSLSGAITAAFFRPDSDVMLRTLRRQAIAHR